ncbi:PTS sugar transporter subunit IIA [Herbiconiux sp. P18]|uniref:PTS sugar transporter subunit IIA n=1 Tax=Herbiconiux liangxiaofengii TaxID=3342795 RepID=UPI0035B90362
MTYQMPPLDKLPEAAISLQQSVDDWQGAVRASAAALTAIGAADASYGDRMIAMIQEYGPYIVIAPGLAMTHARPGPDVHAPGLVIVTLAEPVHFGHAHNDPVSVVIGIAATEADEHVASVAALANLFNDETVIPALAAATDPGAVRRLLAAASRPGLS